MRVSGVVRWAAGAVLLCAIAWPDGPGARLRHLRDRAGAAAGAARPTGGTLLALNTPDARLEVFAVDGGTARFVSSVPVGLEPVAVAARTDTEVWVVNHLSDSISIVDLERHAAARRAHAAGRRRAARHRLRRAEGRRRPLHARLHHHRARSVRTCPRRFRPRSPRRARRARWSTSSTPPTSAPRWAARPLIDRRAVRRHAARPRRDARRRIGLRRGLPVRQPDDDRDRGRGVRRRRRRAGVRRRRRAGAGRPGQRAACRVGCRRRTPTSRASAAPEVGLIVTPQPDQRHLGGRARPQLEQRRALRSARPRRVPHRRARPTRRTRPRPSPTSAPCCSTCSSTRATARSTSATPRRATRSASRGRARSAPRCAATCTRGRSPSSTATRCRRAISTSTSARCRRATTPRRCRRR